MVGKSGKGSCLCSWTNNCWGISWAICVNPLVNVVSQQANTGNRKCWQKQVDRKLKAKTQNHNFADMASRKYKQVCLNTAAGFRWSSGGHSNFSQNKKLDDKLYSTMIIKAVSQRTNSMSFYVVVILYWKSVTAIKEPHTFISLTYHWSPLNCFCF